MSEQLAKHLACLREGFSAQYPKVAALNLESHRHTTRIPHGTTLVLDTCKPLLKHSLNKMVLAVC